MDSASYSQTPFSKVPNKAIVTSNIFICSPTNTPQTPVTKAPTIADVPHASAPATNDPSLGNSYRLEGNSRHSKPTPIFIANNDSLDFNSLNLSLKDLLGETYTTKSNKYGINITCHNTDSYAELLNFLQDN